MAGNRLTAWENISSASNRCVVLMGDSTGELDSGTTDENTYPMQIREKMRARWGIQGPGMLGTWRDEWAFTTGGDVWTNGSTSDAWSKGPLIGAFAHTKTKRADTATKIGTWTKPVWVREAITSFYLWVVDGASSGNFSYSIDGGAYTDVSGTWTQGNALTRILVNSSVTSTVAIRGATAAGVAQTMYLVGIEPITGTGAQLHDFTASAEAITYSVGLPVVSNDPGAFIDLIQPDVLVHMWTNDLQAAWYGSAIGTNLAYYATRMASNGGIIVPMSFWGQDRGADNANNAPMAAQYQTAADNAGSVHINLFDIYGDYTAVNALGYMADTLHPSDLGSTVVAKNLWRLLGRTQGMRPRIR